MKYGSEIPRARTVRFCRLNEPDQEFGYHIRHPHKTDTSNADMSAENQRILNERVRRERDRVEAEMKRLGIPEKETSQLKACDCGNEVVSDRKRMGKMGWRWISDARRQGGGGYWLCPDCVKKRATMRKSKKSKVRPMITLEGACNEFKGYKGD